MSFWCHLFDNFTKSNCIRYNCKLRLIKFTERNTNPQGAYLTIYSGSSVNLSALIWIFNIKIAVRILIFWFEIRLRWKKELIKIKSFIGSFSYKVGFIQH